MKETIKQLIHEFQEWEIPKPFARQIVIPDLPLKLRKAQVFVGMRRTGKTWLMYQQMWSLLGQGWKKSQLLYLNFEDDRLAQFTHNDFQSILDAYYETNPATNGRETAFFFDEIHVIEGWEKFIRRLVDQEKMQIYITGSSARMLSREIATNLRGRSWSQEVFPFNFSEFASFNGIQTDSKLTSKTSAHLRNLAQKYLLLGGFPETLFLPHDYHSALLQNYINTVVYRDVLERYNISNVHAVKTFLLYCLKQLAAPFSITKLYQSLKSQGIAIGKNSLFEYLEYFEDAYALFAVPIYHFSEKVRQVNPKKLYSIDPGIICAYSIKQSFERAAQLENAVFIALRHIYKEIYYYKTENNKEIDFIAIARNGERFCYQVCWDMSDEKTRKRELAAIIEAAAELGLKEATIITEDYQELTTESDITISCIPYWKWAFTFNAVQYPE